MPRVPEPSLRGNNVDVLVRTADLAPVGDLAGKDLPDFFCRQAADTLALMGHNGDAAPGENVLDQSLGSDR